MLYTIQYVIHYTVCYTHLIPILTKAIQELSGEVNKLKTENENMKAEIQILKHK